MANYKYTNPVPSAFTIPQVGDFHLHEGHVYELPEANAHIQALIDQGYLEPVTEAYAPEPETVVTDEQAPAPTISTRKPRNPK